MPLSAFEDLFNTTAFLNSTLAYVQLSDPTTTSCQKSSSFDVAVGDILVLETMLRISNIYSYDSIAGQEESWTDFNHTLHAELNPTTPSATLNPVPLPPAVLFLGSGLLGLAAVRRKKKS